jgi:pilus assembly protein CpaB
MAIAALGAVAVFLLVLSYVNNVSRQVGPMTTAYRFVSAVPRLGVIQDSVLERVQVPVRWMPGAAIQSFDTTRGLVALEDVPKGALLQEGMAGPPPELQPGQRELAILINAETGVAGKVRPGDLVDIYATFIDQVGKGQSSQARVIVANARVLAIGQLQRTDAPPADNNRFAQTEVVPVTFALSVSESLKVTYAESYATKVRLALIAPGTRSGADPDVDVLRREQVVAAPKPAPAPKPTPKPTPKPKATR